MTHEGLVALATTAHAAVLVGALAAYYKFGDRTEVFARSLQGTDQTLRELRRLIAADLAQRLKDDLGDDSTISAIVLEQSTEAYVERPSIVLASEKFRESIRSFVEQGVSRLIDCRTLVGLRDGWSRSARRLSWCLLALALYQALVAGILAFLDRTEVIRLPDSFVLWAAGPTAIILAVCFGLMTQIQRCHDQISVIRERYADVSA